MICSFFLFKQKTAYEMRISDWSSDVCSSDLHSANEASNAPTHQSRRCRNSIRCSSSGARLSSISIMPAERPSNPASLGADRSQNHLELKDRPAQGLPHPEWQHLFLVRETRMAPSTRLFRRKAMVSRSEE